MDLLSILIVLAISVICFAFMAGETTKRTLDAFGAGFLPYREAGWPRGVQEEDPPPGWGWSRRREEGPPRDSAEPPPALPERLTVRPGPTRRAVRG
jgi:hypothetical protein